MRCAIIILTFVVGLTALQMSWSSPAEAQFRIGEVMQSQVEKAFEEKHKSRWTEAGRSAATERHRGGRTGVYDIVVTNQDGERIALFLGRSYATRQPILEK